MDRQIVLDHPEGPNSWDHTVLREDSQKCEGGSQSHACSVRFDIPEGTMSPVVQKATGNGKETGDEMATPLPCLLCYILLILNSVAWGDTDQLQSHCWPKSFCLFSAEVFMPISDLH